MTDDFEAWITPKLLKGHPLIDVIDAYLKAFPGRKSYLIAELFTNLTVVRTRNYEKQEEPHGSE